MRKLKKTLIILAVILLAAGGGLLGWRYYSSKNAAPVKVYPFNYVGMTEYWGDSRESYGPVSTDKIQTVYLSDTQTVSQILVEQDQEVKQGDLLMSFDTTLSKLELERKELEIQKNQMDLEDAQKELQRISWMAPMGIPPTEPETEPTEPDFGRLLSGEYELFRDGHDGTSPNAAQICWIPMGKNISGDFLLKLFGREQPVSVRFVCTPENLTLTVFPAEKDASAAVSAEADGTYRLLPGEYTLQAAAEGYETLEKNFTVQPDSPITVDVTLVQSATEPTEPSEPQPTEPTQPSEPTTPEDPSVPQPTEPSAPTAPPETEAPTQEPTAPAAQKLRVEFECTPQSLSLIVFPREKDASFAIPAETDGSYLLLPGEYTWRASAEGYQSAEKSFTVPEQASQTLRVTITLLQNPTEPSGTEAPATEAPATEAPATEAPATEAPTTDGEIPTAAAETEPQPTAPEVTAPETNPASGEQTPVLTGDESLVTFTAFLSEDSGAEDPRESLGYVIFKITDGNLLKGNKLLWVGAHVYSDGSFSFFDASGNEDFSIPVEPTEPTETEPYVDYIGSGYTYTQIQQMKKEQEQKIRDLEIALRLAESELKIMQKELSDGNIYAEQDGKVISVLTEEEAKLNSQPIIKVSSGGGYYVDASISELERDSMKIGQEVTINDWNTGGIYTGKVVSIGDIPSSSNSYNGMNNPNASSYPFRVFVDESADLQAGNYVSVQYSSSEQTGIYLEKPFLRTENGESFVYVRGEDGLLERRTVTVGKSLNGYYVEIQDGLTEDDYVAFPYGKSVKPGVPTEEGDYSDMYA